MQKGLCLGIYTKEKSNVFSCQAFKAKNCLKYGSYDPKPNDPKV